MKKILLWSLVLLQVAVLGYMAGEREWVLRTGQRVWLRTAPIDPRDPMRGDYVRLRYDVSEVPWTLCRDEVAQWKTRTDRDGNGYYDYKFTRMLRDRVVFSELEIDEHGLGTVVALHASEPVGKIFLRGRVQQISSSGVEVRYGLEAMFTEQGVARKMEDSMRTENEGRPLRIEVAVGRNGLAVMRGHRWEDVSLRLVLESEPEETAAQNPEPRRAGTRRRDVIGAKLTLKNHSTEPLALIVREGGRSFRMIPANQRWGVANERWNWVGEKTWATTAAATPLASEVRVLQPGETLTERIDFRNERWRVTDRNDASATPQVFSDITTETWAAWFRLEYVSPTAAQCAELKLSAKPWLGRVASRSFNPTGGMD